MRRRERIRRRLIGRTFDSAFVARVTRARHVVVLGDSHSAVLRGWRPPGWWFQVQLVGGATASGIVNPNSRTGAQRIFLDRLARCRPWQSVMVMLGEVDCGYVIWRHARAEGLAIDAALEETIARYRHFVATEVAPRCREVLLMSSPMPTLPDDASSWGEVAQRRADVTASQRERTELTSSFNEALARACAEEGWRFVDATTTQLDPATGLIRSELVQHGTGDHHLSETAYRRHVTAALPARPHPGG